MRPFALIVLAACSLLTLSLMAPANAGWFKKDKPEADPIQTYQPPAVNALEMYCEPLRQRAAELDKTPKALKLFVQPRRAFLIREHEKCKAEFMQQEHDYLKHVDVQQSPSLPKLKTDSNPITTPKTGADNAIGE